MLETEAVLRSPDQQDEAGLLATVLVSARPLHLASSLAYINTFVFSSQQEMASSLKTLEMSVSLLEGVEARSSRVSSSRSSRLKRELSLEDLISLTDEMEQRYDRHGVARSRETKLTTRDIFREKLARRLELSSEEMTRHQEEAWARVDCVTLAPVSHGKTFLQNIQNRLICSTKKDQAK